MPTSNLHACCCIHLVMSVAVGFSMNAEVKIRRNPAILRAFGVSSSDLSILSDAHICSNILLIAIVPDLYRLYCKG